MTALFLLDDSDYNKNDVFLKFMCGKFATFKYYAYLCNVIKKQT